MNSDAYLHLDGNAAASELNRVFAVDITTAQDSVLSVGQRGILPRRACT